MIISETLPAEEGQRNHMLFWLARRIKGLFPNATPDHLRPVVRMWQQQALPVISTKDFEETWFDFLRAWKNVKLKYGDAPMERIVQAAKDNPPPPEAEQYESPKMKLLVAIVAELQRSQADEEGNFHLDVRTAARSIDTNRTTAWKFLKLMEMDGLLKVMHQGGRKKGEAPKATRWRFIPRGAS